MMSKLRDWFSFSKGERIGILLLSFFVVLLIGVKIYLHYFKNEEVKPVDFSTYEKQIDEFKAHLKKQPKKTYKPYFQKDTNNLYHSNYKKKRKNLHIELNTSDTSNLVQLYGIGKVLAIRIIKYRERLGGYYDKRQLLEVHGIKPETYAKIENQIWVDTTKIKKIDLNEVTFKDLLKHPYLEYEQVKTFIKYQKKHRIFNLKQLQTDGIFDNEFLEKLRPYFIVSGN